MKTSLLISTYNWPEALGLVLKSAERQSVQPFEILIADDGSKEETKKLIENFKMKTLIKVVHVWHEDKGFRRSKILNKAIAVAAGDYIVQIDGDCIMHSDFVKDHQKMAENNQFLFGSRVNIQQGFLKELFERGTINFGFYSKGIKKRTRAMRIPILSSTYKASNELSTKLRGCNLSFWKKDFIAINGYNEDFEGWGREDSEMVIRLLNSGVMGKRLRYRGIIYHIWHLVKDQSRFEINDSLQLQTQKNKVKRCENGITKYL
ncbi:glycosyltransferase family 2 protein [Aequorivita sp. CIP111184]|uniref:glycosyltransferase family 2 protein n=1 Tax=Aequorivita sp. CIP111184 TaxID=2211356 RepID=UPI000DBBB4B9|nr:glycosyltransferase family 2 protein [Aequorivita sp. CIP111184]SRX55307.1 Chondroitin synthase [Aequorivita sp. CIP111184]